MRIIQTLWTKPGMNAGWIDKQFHFLSWALSCLQLRKFYTDVELYTDDLGKHLLIDIFKLPYTKVHLTLNDFNYPTYLWSAPKILSYSLQEEPFIHVDGDIYIFSSFNESKITRKLVYQNKEIESADNGFYTRIFNNIYSICTDKCLLPEWIQSASINHIEALNAGVFGGSDLSFFKLLGKTAFNFYDQHRLLIDQMQNPSHATHISEQVLASYLLQRQEIDHIGLFTPNYFIAPVNPPARKEVMTELNTIEQWQSDHPVPFTYFALDHFGISPLGKQYIHMLGASKKSLFSSRQVARRLLLDYPDYYKVISEYFSTHQVDNKSPKRFNIAGNCEIQNFGTQLLNTNYSLRNKLHALSCRKVFDRTIFLYQIITGKTINYGYHKEAFIEDFPHVITTLSDIDQFRLADIYNFEKARYYFALSSPDDNEFAAIEHKSMASIKKLYSRNQPDLDDFVISLNPYIQVVSTKWNWRESKSFAKEPIPMEPLEMLFIVDLTTNSLVEMDLTKLNELTLQAFSSPCTYSAGFNMLLDMINVTDLKDLNLNFFQGIIHLMAQGILIIK